jgi:histidinol-phosphate/aromatic aminotransferase/cobyric acid decarboxylase-like protein
LVKILDETFKTETLIFLDESYIEFTTDRNLNSVSNLIEKYPNLFVLRSFTKVFGLAGLRIGYGLACEDIINILVKVKLPWNVNILAQIAAITALKHHKSYLEKTCRLVKREKDFLFKNLLKIRGFRVYPSDANFLLVNVQNSGLTSTKLREKLLEYGILVRDCSNFKGLGNGYIRVSIKKRKENKRLLEALTTIIK